ncbi:pyridoxamine 5'-phosphate oxidase [Metallibacterium sp.]|uniref:pyridoxamine 5'-phosphate oxidase n=1 Tax=Metallibacterium sp. TaxID=2940281 RepID=UPI002610FE4D|nr:pyridoxamine 5'-phosphate oxidase [Metallibacterium sp.]
MLNPELLQHLRDLLEQARACGDPEATAMTLATVGGDGRPHARIVLLKGIEADGLRFYTNYRSAKGEEIRAHAEVALCLYWKLLGEVKAGGVQLRVEGRAARLHDDESDAYFASRPRGSQIGAWASLQSQTLPDRAAFDARVAEYEQQFADKDVPRPPHWGGYRVLPDMIEVWHGREFRLHERRRWERFADVWRERLLYP